MSKKLVLKLVDWYEGDTDIIYVVDEESFSRLAADLVNNCEEDELPKLELAMYTPEQIAEAERIGEEMA